MKKNIDWTTSLFLIISHVVGIAGTGVYVYFNGLHPLELLNFALFYALTGLSITAGYHRFFAHRSYESHSLLKLFYLVFGACAFENSALKWASDHRLHHKHVDTPQDPYNIKEGGWHAHMGWIFFDRAQWTNLDNVKDLSADPYVMWQDKYYPWIAAVVGTLFPLLIGLSVGRPLGGLLWGGFFRVAFVHHTTFFINSLAHMWGRQPYSDQDTSKDNTWLAFLTYGEGYHNFHHKFQADYRNGVRWYQWDPTKWTIALCARFNLTSRLNRTPEQKILNAKLLMDVLHVRKKAQGVPHELWNRIQSRLEARRHQLETAYAQWHEAKLKHKRIKAEKMGHSRETLIRWEEELKNQRRKFVEAKQGWMNAVNQALEPTGVR